MRVAQDERDTVLFRECQALLDLPELKDLNDIKISRNGCSWIYNKILIYLHHPYLGEVLKDSDVVIFVEEFTDDKEISIGCSEDLKDFTSSTLNLKEATSGSLNLNEAKSGTLLSSIGQSYLCSICGKGFTEKKKFMDHCGRNQSKENLVCGVCKRAFCSLSNLKQHQIIHDVEGTQYSCSICLKNFKHRRNLTVHFNQHLKQTKFQCSKCLKSFSCVQNLKRHERKIHSP